MAATTPRARVLIEEALAAARELSYLARRRQELS